MSDHPVPFVAIADADLARGAAIRWGDLIHCPTCGQPHALYGSAWTHGNGQDARLLFYDCGEASYLASVVGYLINGGEVSDRD